MTYDRHYAAEYNRARHEWHLSEHVTAPRRTWQEAVAAGEAAPLTAPPLSETDVQALAGPPQCTSTLYIGVFFKCASWGFRFIYNGQRITRQGYASEQDAALAHDQFVIEQGIRRRLLLPDAREDVA